MLKAGLHQGFNECARIGYKHLNNQKRSLVMQEIDKIIRAWKDDDYLMSLSTNERRALPENPAGLVEFSGHI
jgi:mersacidin/lichenicidin family type 2 lantibiotic